MSQYRIYKNSKYEFKYFDKIYAVSDIHPRLDQKREAIMEDIQKKFRAVIKRHIPAQYIKGRHPVDDILDLMLARNTMSLLANIVKQVDPLIPKVLSSMELDPLREDLRVKLRKNKRLQNRERELIIATIIGELDLAALFEAGYMELLNYFRSGAYRSGHVVKKRRLPYVTLTFDGDSVDVYHKLYDKLVRRHTDVKKQRQPDGKYDADTLIWCLLKRYIIIKSHGNQLAVHPKTQKEFMEYYGTQYEIFGSALNTYHSMYCSMFYDIEKYFGSFGSFYAFTPIAGAYTMNPPYDNTIMRDAARQITEAMAVSTRKILVLMCIPVWDEEGKKYLQKRCAKISPPLEIYVGYPALEVIEASGMLKHKKIVCINDMSYFDWGWYRRRTAANTYFMAIQNIGEFDSTLMNSINYNKR